MATVSPSSFPPPPSVSEDTSVEDCARLVVDTHPDEVALYASGKGCIGFLVASVMRMTAGRVTVKAAHSAVVQELEGRVSLS